MNTRLTRRTLLAGTAAAALAAPAIVRAQGGALKVGVLLPRSGAQAGIGQDCFRGVELAGPLLKDIGLPDLQIMNADTETNVEVARCARREADLGRRAASRRRVRLRPEHRDRAGRRAEGHSLRHQHRGRAGHHRAGLQVRVPQLPDRADDSGRRLRQPEGNLRRGRHRAEVGRVHARQRHVRHRDAARHRRRDAEVQHALRDQGDDRLRSRPRAISRSRSPRRRRPAPTRC